MFRVFGNFFRKMKQLFTNHTWFSFSVCLLIGFAIPILLGQSFQRGFAKPVVNLDRFDPDVHPAIDVSHPPPLIARFDEKVKLEFDFACGYIAQTGSCCKPNATLFVSYGEKNPFAPISLAEENHDSLRVLSANLPAADAKGESLRYYLQTNDPVAGLDVRYPLEGTIDLFAVPDFIRIDLPAQRAMETGELALELPWGNGPEAVGLRKREGYPWREGPVAMDVADDGRIALLDHVNERILIFDPAEKRFTAVPLPFALHGQGDVQFDRNGQVAVFDPVGEPVGQSTVDIPRLYRFLPDGRVGAEAPVFVWIPDRLTKDLEVFDRRDNRFIAPFDPSGAVNSREQQRHRRNPNLLYRYVEGLDPYVARFADVRAGLAFELDSVSPLGAIAFFEKTPQGYVAVFGGGQQFRAIWFDPSGVVLKDVALPEEDYSEIELAGCLAVDPEGDLYVMNSVETGIQILSVAAP